MILEYVHAAFQRETFGVDVYGFVEEGNIGRQTAVASICTIYDLLQFSSLLKWETAQLKNRAKIVHLWRTLRNKFRFQISDNALLLIILYWIVANVQFIAIVYTYLWPCMLTQSILLCL